MDLSVVFPVYNEAGNVEALVDDVVRTLEPLGRDYEIVVVDDGSEDGTGEVLRKLKS
ncbi:MAG: glycosyltransferase, partial [Candidatus Binatia bacterium]